MEINKLDPAKRIIVIAEMGSNHNGSLTTAKEMISAAVECGVDLVKFQTYKTDKLITKEFPVFPRARLLGYKKQIDRFKSLEFNYDQIYELHEYSRGRNIVFLSTPFDNEAVDFLNPIVPAFKVSSGDLINVQLLRYVASKDKPVILSTGQASVEEINSAIKIFKADKLALMHCVSSYPTPDEEVNLRSISFLKKLYNYLTIGYSDHSVGNLACISAVAMGAQIIEKHFTLDKTHQFGDHPLSADPDDLARLVSEIRRLEEMLGTEEKLCRQCELESKKQLRRKLHINCDIKKGTVISDAMLIPLISGEGIAANRIDDVVGKTVIKDIKKGEPVSLSVLK